ncbi:glycoside hydrolase family 2 TIM barrel-domain containing protein [Bacteroides sp.]|uniref:glycoside hydrolase family 2 TIM barrel-domain containing protein n=1 Tax=Bacteroides sp. TaxID=29523 RepID=UPI0026303C43|nr:glycoside hydrolase family 2 TIM barrel-domain containing protein [Bacteroides sp.]MDD3036557.1 glycoside hydrolase family 2 TIM barrel-domain containing protein [Bacteroides sp.]
MKNIYAISFLLVALNANAQDKVLEGFSYVQTEAPTGKEWEAPQQVALNKEQPHAWFFTFANSESARRVLPEHSSYYQSLNGPWKFHWVGNPDERPAEFYQPAFDASNWDTVDVPMQWNVTGIQKDGSLKYGTPIYANQPVIFQHKVEVGDWKGGVMRTPPQDWVTYKHRNEVGSYRRTFTIPGDWKGREVYINFDGVSSFFYLWINGHYIGFSKNSRNTASFNVTPYLKKGGENVVAVEVYRNSDGSFLEAQDMFRLPGIFRSVSLTSTAKTQVRDFRVFPDLDANYKNGTLRVEADIRNLGKKAMKDYTISYSLYANKLYSDENTLVNGVSGVTEIGELEAGNIKSATTNIQVNDPKKWSAEAPYRYVLVGQLKDKKGKIVETFSTALGFCKVEIKDTPADKDEFGLAGRYYYINGKTVKLKGVNRQEINPATGNTISHQQMEDEIMLMKQGNINHVRNSHYSCDPYWYYYCDKYGIYLEDEANIESHQYYYGDASLSHVPEFEAAHVARVMELAHSHINHPSIVIWSLGNEAGPGKNFVTAYEKLRAFDPSRPVQYERNNDIVDMGSNQYPSIGWMRGAVTGKYNIKYPFHVSEYAHSMGNAVGNLVDYWDAIESTNFFCGAAIWDWVDQALYYYDRRTGERYLAYGGDFGDKPNSGMFCMNGVLFPGHLPKPAFYEVKKVYQNVGVRPIDLKKGMIEIFNKNYFTSLSDYELVWMLYKDGKLVKSNSFKTLLQNVDARTKVPVEVSVDYGELEKGSEYFLKVQFRLLQDKPWAKAGFVQMEEQLKIKDAEEKPSLASVTASQDKPEVTETETFTTVAGKNFAVKFDNKQGTIHSLEYDKRKVLCDGEGPKINALRAPVDNDNWAYQQWFEKGLHNLKHKVLSYNQINAKDKTGNTVQLMYTVESQAPNGATLEGGTSGRYSVKERTDRPFGPDDFKFVTSQIWTIYPDGSIELHVEITSNEAALVLARLGYVMQVPTELQQYSYYGRGPWNNFNDRRTGSFIEMYQSTVKDQFVDFPKPQSMGNREEVRWCALTDATGNGIEFVANGPMSASALPWSDMELTLAPHPYQLPQSKTTHLHLDLGVTGLGGNSCGQGAPLDQDRIKAENHPMSFIIRPVRGATFTETARVAADGEVPLAISRERNGLVTIQSQKKDAEIIYTLNGSKKELTYNEPFNLREGGKVTAYYKNNKALSIGMTFPKIENVPLTVVYASSQETGGEDATNLVDENPNTIWHTMYSVTVAKYPHWVDFDAGEVRNVKGFVYLPRQDGSMNGFVKEYSLEVSMDGKKWSEAVAKGSFDRDKKAKRVELKTPVQARYIRFTCLNSQNGADFAGGAEFSIIAD